MEHFGPYLVGVLFTLEIDHWSLRWIMTSGTQQNGRLAMWALKLQKYDFTIRHRKGSQNSNADAHYIGVKSSQHSVRVSIPAQDAG